MPLFPLAAVVILAVPGASPTPLPSVRSQSQVLCHTAKRPAVAASTPLITADLLARWLAVRAELTAFLTAHPAIKDSAKSYGKTYRFTFEEPGASVPQIDQSYDFVALAAHFPGVAAVFATHHLRPALYMPIRIAIRQAFFIGELGENLGYELIEDTASVDYKNVVMVLHHRRELAAIGLDPNVKAATQ